jgi:hypothetical protein
MKKLLILFLLLSATCKGQFGISVEYFPTNPVLSTNQFYLNIDYLRGGAIKWGLCAKTNNSASVLIIGVKTESLIVKPSESTAFSFLLSTGFDIDEAIENKFSDPHHRHFMEAGFGYALALDETFTLKMSASKRYWGDDEDFVGSIGASIKL